MSQDQKSRIGHIVRLPNNTIGCVCGMWKNPNTHTLTLRVISFANLGIHDYLHRFKCIPETDVEYLTEKPDTDSMKQLLELWNILRENKNLKPLKESEAFSF